ncbi:hypothetical protein [Anaerotignum sp. MB30-C6]|uniref:hypothetical protein n=1 Tax=Anaerotignum sp. MB30-C6 TaxID=3070814 RepID=UPI0027DBF844|nr:hypothetical protein [Anaerotignum sp. MB30-C6]WMI81608.1 hypothetical protein RBQ60_02395 [Anaerotignum sp. MB30-C6]
MAEFTNNYNLEKPAQNEFYNVDVQNQNMDKIDAALATAGKNPQLEADVAEIKAEVGNTNDTGATETTGTMMAKLNALLGRSVIKSIQRGKFGTPDPPVVSKTINIATVNPYKCIVLLNNFIIGGSSTISSEVTVWGGILDAMTANSITIAANRFDRYDGIDYGGIVSWQVVEFE